MFNWLKKSSGIQKPKTLGQLGEEFAQREYQSRGCKIIARNEFNKKGLRRGEIDFIAEHKNKIIFVEVKTRKPGGDKFGQAEDSVNWSKQQKLLKAAKIFLLKSQRYQSLQPQIDVCVVEYSEFDPVRGMSPQGDSSRAESRAASNGVDKHFFCAKIITNAVEDWS